MDSHHSTSLMVKKKSLGQHFLHQVHFLNLVAEASNIKKGSEVVEIGPGDGALTAVLLNTGAKVIALEKDHRLLPILAEKFANEIKSKQLTIVEGDALEFDASKYFGKKTYAAVGNIPYYITGALIRKFLTEGHQPHTLVFLIQKEVAERIVKSKKESILSLSVKTYGTPKYVKTVPKGAFVPPPKVDSAILAVTDISRKNFEAKTLSDKVRPTSQEAAFREERFFKLLHKGFGQKRKLLASNVRSMFSTDSVLVLEECGIPAKARAEDVQLSEWLKLASY